jgi:hypothetical protein
VYAPRHRRGIKDQGGRENDEYRCLPAVDDEQQSRFLKASVTKTTLCPAKRQAISVDPIQRDAGLTGSRAVGQFNLRACDCHVSKSRHTPVARSRCTRLFSSIGTLISEASKDNMAMDAITDRPAPNCCRRTISRIAGDIRHSLASGTAFTSDAPCIPLGNSPGCSSETSSFTCASLRVTPLHCGTTSTDDMLRARHGAAVRSTSTCRTVVGGDGSVGRRTKR